MKPSANRPFKTALRRVVISRLPDRWGDWLLTAKHSLWWRTVQRDWHRKHFADQDDSKEWLKTALATIRRETGLSSLAILEFGCNAGMNLHGLRQDAATAGITYCGIDINPKAIAFAKARFPSDTFHIGDHRWFIRHAGALGSFNLFVAAGVLCYVDEKHTRLILESARRVADYILVRDDGQRFFEASGVRASLFDHPYTTICKDVGLDVLEMKAIVESGSPQGYFLARTGRLS